MVRNDSLQLLRGFGKLVAVVVAAGLAGTAIGIALAKVTGSEDSGTSVLPQAPSATSGRTSTPVPATPTQATAVAATPTTVTAPARPTAATPPRTPPSTRSSRPRLQVLSAQLHRSRAGAGLVTVRVRVINRATRPLAVAAPVLLAGGDEMPRDSVRGSAARPLLKGLAPGSSATSELRFTTSSAVAERLTATPRARLRVASRSIVLRLAASSSGRP